MENLLIFFYILISISLILIILLQQGKGSDIGSAFGVDLVTQCLALAVLQIR